MLAHRVGRVVGAVVFQSVDRYGRSRRAAPRQARRRRSGRRVRRPGRRGHVPPDEPALVPADRAAGVFCCSGPAPSATGGTSSGTAQPPAAAAAGLALNLGVVVAVALMAGWAMSAAWIVGLVFVYPAFGWLIELSEHFPMAGFVKRRRPPGTGPAARSAAGLSA